MLYAAQDATRLMSDEARHVDPLVVSCAPPDLRDHPRRPAASQVRCSETAARLPPRWHFSITQYLDRSNCERKIYHDWRDYACCCAAVGDWSPRNPAALLP